MGAVGRGGGGGGCVPFVHSPEPWLGELLPPPVFTFLFDFYLFMSQFKGGGRGCLLITSSGGAFLVRGLPASPVQLRVAFLCFEKNPTPNFFLSN